MNILKYETVIGLEVHIQLNTLSKAFCRDFNSPNAIPNSNISQISLAHPGALPRMNKAQIEKALLLGVAFGCEINRVNFFDRKNYFYPDLPKGYQITQDKEPICKNGNIRFISEGKLRVIRLHHIHMEEDAGKLIHDQHPQLSFVDFNRAGVPLLEVVTEPDFRTGQEVSDFLSELQKVVQHLNISDANMEEGSFRCDCNVSVRLQRSAQLGERCEIKNMNSRRNAKNAIECEALRQIKVIEEGGVIHKTTMLYNPVLNKTLAMRHKESENDYRYFPDPDLPPVNISDEWLNDVTSSVGMLPVDRYLLLKDKYNLNHSDAEFLTENISYSTCFMNLAEHVPDIKEWGELLINKIIPHVKANKTSLEGLGAIENFIPLMDLISGKRVAKSAIYQYILPIWLKDITQNPKNIAEQLQLIKSDNQNFLDEIIGDVISKFPEKILEYKKGKKGLISFFMGQVMQKSGGKADPKILQKKIEDYLN